MATIRLPLIQICAGFSTPWRLISDWETVEEFEDYREAQAAMTAACSASVQLGALLASSKPNRERA